MTRTEWLRKKRRIFSNIKKLLLTYLPVSLAFNLISCFPGELVRNYNEGVAYYNKGLSAIKDGNSDDALSKFDWAKWYFDFAWRNWDYMTPGFSADERLKDTAYDARKLAGYSCMYRGVIFREARQYDKAISEFSAALSYKELPKKGQATIMAMRGACYFYLGDFDNSIEDYRNAHRMDPMNPLVKGLGTQLGY